MNKLITYSFMLLLSLLLSQSLFSNSIGNKTKDGIKNTKVLTTQLLQKMYPNPANMGSTIFVKLQLQQSAVVNLVVLDMIGNKVINLQQELEVGQQNIHFQTSQLTEGVYFVNIISGEKKQVQRLIMR